MLTTFTTNTSSTAASSKYNSINMVSSGTFGGATVALQVYDQSAAAWVTVYSCTSAETKNVLIGSGMSYRINVTGGTAQNINVYILDVQSKDLNL